MGSSASKASSKTVSATASTSARKYPTRSPARPSNPNRSAPRRSTPPPPPPPSRSSAPPRDYGIEEATAQHESPHLNAALNARLQQLGPVIVPSSHPNPSTYGSRASSFMPPSSSPSSSSYPSASASASAYPPNTTTTSSSTSPSSQTQTNSQPPFQPSPSTPSQRIFPFPSSTNPAVSLLTARYRLAEEAEAEFALMGKSQGLARGRRFLDVQTIRQMLVMREKGLGGAEIEQRLGLGRGTVGVLGERGRVVSVVNAG